MWLFSKNKNKSTFNENPYIDGHNEWQEMFGSYVNHSFIWRIVFFLFNHNSNGSIWKLILHKTK
jgi:type IV secretory pathway TrbF-like protein